MGVCSGTSKCILIILNLLFWASAALLIYAGVRYISSADGVLNEVHNKPALVTFGAAALLFLCGVIGIAGAFSEKKVLLGIFTLIIVATLTLFVFVSVTLFTQVDHAKNQTDEFVLKQFNHYGSPNLTELEVEVSRVARAVALENTGTVATTKEVAGTTIARSTTSATTTTTISTTTKAPETTTTSKAPETKTTKAQTTTAAANTTTAAKTTAAPTTVTSVTTTTAAPSDEGVNSTEFIDKIQSSLECCGYENYTDWKTYDYWKNPNSVPSSCCNETAASAHNRTCPKILNMKKDLDLIYTQNCKEEVDQLVNIVYKFLSYTMVAFCIFVFICFCATMFLMCSKKDDGFSYSSIVA